MKKNRIANMALVAAIMISFTNIIFAQRWEGKRDEIHEKVKAEKVAFFTSKLDLSPDEAQKFWPVYNQYEKEKMEIYDMFMERPKSYNELSDADAEKYLDRLQSIKEKEFELEKKYIPRFKKVLPVKKVAGVYYFEKEFRKEVFERVRERMNKREKSGTKE